MTVRSAVLTVGAAVIIAVGVSYAVGSYMADKGLTQAQRGDTETVIKDFVAANPDLLKPPATPVDPATLAAAAPPSYLSDGQRTEVEGVIKNYLIANPEIIRDAIAALQEKEDAAAQAAQTKAITDNKSLLFDSTREVVTGNPKGDVTLVEFFDYNCAYCRRAHADMKSLLDSDKNLRFVFKEFPVLGDGSVQAAQISIAVHLVAPDKYVEFHDALISEKGQVDGARALAIAEEIGLDKAKIEEMSKSDEVKATISETYDLASKLSLTGTPSYATPTEVIVGAVGLDSLKQKIAAARAACATTTC
jgi:protein-disulfide isomerase